MKGVESSAVAGGGSSVCNPGDLPPYGDGDRALLHCLQFTLSNAQRKAGQFTRCAWNDRHAFMRVGAVWSVISTAQYRPHPLVSFVAHPLMVAAQPSPPASHSDLVCHHHIALYETHLHAPPPQYVYESGTNVTFVGCANPDGDPLGPWCAIDPNTCPSFAGQLTLPGSLVVNYDYCESAPLWERRDNTTCTDHVVEFGQCGGKSNCTEYGCKDAPWAGVCCPKGLTCVRQNMFYYQCLDALTVSPVEPSTAVSSPSVGDGGVVGPGPLPSPSPAPLSPSPKLPGKRVRTVLRIDYDYNKLLHAGAMDKFKESLTAWLASVAGPPEYIYSIGEPGLWMPLWMQRNGLSDGHLGTGVRLERSGH